MINYKIRIADESDAKTIHDIYGFYVELDYVSFTTINPSLEEYKEKIINTKKMYPFYIAEDENGKILGYICGSKLRSHEAYNWNVETTIVLSKDAPRRKGIATALYKKFMETLTKQGFQFVYGVIVDTNTPSIELHKALGFEQVAHLPNSGFKMGKYSGVYFFMKQIGKLENPPPEIIPFDKLPGI